MNTPSPRCPAGYPDYLVYSDGSVVSNKQKKPRLLKPQEDHGYLRVRLYAPGRTKRFFVHRLVCELFHGPAPTPEHVVRHLDGVGTNNRADNLAWGLPPENEADKIKHGTLYRGRRHVNAKLDDWDVDLIRALYRDEGHSTRALAKAFGVSQALVQRITANKVRIDPWEEYRCPIAGGPNPEASWWRKFYGDAWPLPELPAPCT